MEEEDAIVHRPPSPTRRDETSIKWWAMLIRPCLAEYIGTTLFVFAGILSTFHSANEKGAVVSVALGHGMALFVMVATTATVRLVYNQCMCRYNYLTELDTTL